jgi:hypothetical protein
MLELITAVKCFIVLAVVLQFYRKVFLSQPDDGLSPGAMTLSITAFRITTLSIPTFSITPLSITIKKHDTQHNIHCHTGI